MVEPFGSSISVVVCLRLGAMQELHTVDCSFLGGLEDTSVLKLSIHSASDEFVRSRAWGS